MAEEDLNFEDRFADVPAEPTQDEETAKKKAELLKLVSPPEPPQIETPARNMEQAQAPMPVSAPVPPPEVAAPEPTPQLPKFTLPSTVPQAEFNLPQGSAVEYTRAPLQRAPIVSTPHQVLADQRAEFKRQLDASPALKMKFAAIMSAEEGSDSKARVALAESAMNRAYAKGITSIETILDPRYYEPFQNKSYYTHLARIMNDPKYRDAVYKDMDHALDGSNISNLATDNASGSVKANSKNSQTMTYEGDNKEGFFRKDINPQVHGARNVAAIRSWVADTQTQMANAKPDASGAQMLSSTPIADQLIKMRGGGVGTPQERAMIQGLISPTPLEKQPTQEPVALTRLPAAEENLKPGVIKRGRVTHTTDQVQGELPTAVPQAPVTLPGPQRTIGPGGPTFQQTMTQNPTVLSTVASWLSTAPPPPMPPSIMDDVKNNVKAAAANISPVDAVTNPISSALKFYGNLSVPVKDWFAKQYNIPNLKDPENWSADTGQKLMTAGVDMLRTMSNADQAFTKGAVEGIVQNVGGLFTGPMGMGAALTHIATGGGPGTGSFLDWAVGLNQKLDAYSKEVSGGLKPGEPQGVHDIGNYLGRVAGIGPISTGINVASDYAGPKLMDYLYRNAPELPSLVPVTPADAKDLSNVNGVNKITVTPNGDYLMAETPAGPVHVDHRMANALGWFGLGTMAFIFAPGVLKTIYTKTGPTPGNTAWTGDLSPLDRIQRDVRGVPNSGLIRSSWMDYLKSQTLSTSSPLGDVLERWVRTTPGADPRAAANAIDATHIYSNTGQRNFVTSAMENGQLRTPTLRFSVTNTMRDIKDFANNNIGFRDYMRLQMHHDELSYNNYRVQQAIAMNATPAQMRQVRARYPTEHLDTNNVVTNINDVERAIRQIETANPDVVQGYNMYRDYINETQRFVATGTHAPENRQALMDHTLYAPNTPTFSTGRQNAKIWKEIRDGQDPVHVLEREVGNALVNRMQHEVDGTYIHSMPPNTHFREVDDAFIRERNINPDAIYTHRRDGVTHTYLADPFIVGLMKLDPAGYQGTIDSAFRMFKNAFQWTTTGPLAPFFAGTAAMRTWEQSFVTAPAWSRRVGPLSMALEIPRALTGEQAGRWSNMINNVATWAKSRGLGNVVGDQNINTVARILTAQAAKQFNGQFDRAGGMNKDWLDALSATDRRAYINNARNASTHPAFQSMMDYMSRVAQHPMDWAGSAKDKFRSVADSPNTAWARKNVGTIDPTTGRPIGMAKLVAESRRLTGDPAERGAGRYMDAAGNTRRLPYQADTFAERFAVGASRVAGSATDVFHKAVPWSGVLVRSPAATFTAMANHPFRSAIALSTTQIIPEMVSYAWAWNQGPDYVNYMMEGRSDNARNNYTYIAVPGRPPWEGVEIPNYQEGLLPRRAAIEILDQMMGRSQFTPRQEVSDWLSSVIHTNLEPPLPSPMTIGAGIAGVTMPQGVTGSAFMPKQKNIKDYNQPDNVMERLARNLAPSIADFWTQWYGSYHASTTVPEGIWAGTKAVGKRAVQRTPLVRDVLGLKPDVAGSTRITQELYEANDKIDALKTYYQKEITNRGLVNTKGRSTAGAELARRNNPELAIGMGDKVQAPGLSQPPPTNPLFMLSIKAIEAEFIKDSPQKGGRGYLSLWSEYGQYTRFIDSLRNVNEGNAGLWIQKFNKDNKKEVEKLKAKGVDTDNFRSVKNYYTLQRNKQAKELLYFIQAGEQQIDKIPAIRQALGPDKHFTLDMAHPYKAGLTMPPQE